jgi:peptide deformylase
MSHLVVLHEPDDRLRTTSQEIDRTTIASPEMRKLIFDLKETMKLEDGVGIAAPQVGVHQRVIIVDLPDRGPSAFFNPVITERSFKLIDSTEGCLSVPECSGIVKRHRGVTVDTLNEQGEKETLKVTDLSAIIFQHEIDHLDGILFIDRAEKIRRIR